MSQSNEIISACFVYQRYTSCQLVTSPHFTMLGSQWFIFERTTLNAFNFIKRSYVIKRKFPIDRTLEDSLPVDRFPIREDSAKSVHVWGLGEHGALGLFRQKRSKMRGRSDARFHRFYRPLRLTFAEHHAVVDVAAGYGFTIFVVRTALGDKLFGSGINTDSQIGVHEPRRNAPLGLLLAPAPIALPTTSKKYRFMSVSAGRAHTAVASEDGAVFTFGNNAYGQCGRKIVEGEKYVGSNVVHCIPNLDGSLVKQVECGQDHTLFLTRDGKVYACGWGADGQTGLGHFNTCGKPSQVLGDIQGENIVQISSKGDCVLAINDAGDVFGWGNSEYSQIFEESVPLQQINKAIHLKKCRGFGKIVNVAAAGSYCLMLNEEGDVFSWGYGILGQGPSLQQSWIPRVIPSTLFGRNEFRSDSRVKSIATGLNYSAAITNYGDLYCWGKNRGGCLGLGDDKDQFFPLRVAIGLSAVKVTLGVDHTVCITRT